MNNKKKTFISWIAGLLALLLNAPTHAALDISQVPLFLSINITPNVVLTLDNSESMIGSFTPDERKPVKDNVMNLKRYSSPSWNAQYYNPKTAYTIPIRIDNITYSTSFERAYENGFDSSKNDIDLSTDYSVIDGCSPADKCVALVCPDGLDCSAFIDQAAFYHLYYADLPGATLPNNCDDSRETEDCYIRIKVGSKDDITAGKSEQQKQNFAIWFSFYRTRALTMMSAAMSAISALSENQIRLAWHTISHNLKKKINMNCPRFGTTCQGSDFTDHENRMRTLDALKTDSTTETHRTDFYNWIAHMQFTGSTPLRGALAVAGEYYTLSGKDSPYAEEPYVTEGTEISCRKNFDILFTDGVWKTQPPNDFGGDIDSTKVTLPDGKVYEARAPYSSSYTDNLGDIAFKYWSTDLRSNLVNNLTPTSGFTAEEYWNPRYDPATWQHMVVFAIGLGLSETMKDPVWGGSTYSGDYQALVAGTKSWPKTVTDLDGNNTEPGHVYDLWHAALNSRGQFFSADSPASMVKAFATVFSTIGASSGTSSAIASSAHSLSASTQTLRFEASLNSQSWYGKVTATPLNNDTGREEIEPVWTSSFPDHSARNIFTWDGDSGAVFDNCSHLTQAQKTSLDKNASGKVDNLCSDRLNWLRGDQSKEERMKNGIFRNRIQSIMGDVTHSGPAYVSGEDLELDAYTYPEAEFYRAFVDKKAARVPMLYVGANDGMLHAFQADAGQSDSGKEKFAFIPNAVFSKLNLLTDPDYKHQFYVDGSPTVSDAYWGSKWKTILVSGLGGGGKSVFALDITDPASFGTSDILWEFTDSDLGYTYSRPQIGRLNNGEWAAIFGNGYSNTSENPDAVAYLYVVRLSDGVLLKKIAAGSSKGNGLSTPAVHDTDSDGIADVVYAGDLLGNLWKFDLSAADTSAWALGNGTKPLFTATNPDGTVQSITVRPVVSAHPDGGYMVDFGTGRFIALDDSLDMEVQSIYGIRDNGANNTAKRSDLQQQGIVKRVNSSVGVLRITSANTVDWSSKSGWYLDLIVPTITAVDAENTAATLKYGERVLASPFILFGRLFVTSFTPSTDKCDPTGTLTLYQLDPLTGARPSVAVVDVTKDGAINTSDLIGAASVSGVETRSGYGDNASITASTDGTTANAHVEGDKGSSDFDVLGESGTVTRVFWQQLQ